MLMGIDSLVALPQFQLICPWPFPATRYKPQIWRDSGKGNGLQLALSSEI
ncbi:hypothetical protein J2W69_000403 [Rheinheimera soli]|uniref:Uncharacterized protein n=1 Tax=Rheinheimera soli TaxID=443616 RepID=A0ABU1VUT8_9GAMM|nr:hypothetical protein [Rheinheimera soli]